MNVPAMKTQLGKIKKAHFGKGGYQDSMIGITFDLGGEGWGVGDFWRFSEDKGRIERLFSDTRRDSVDQLVGIPIEVTFDGMMMKSWRPLTEVL